MLLFDIREQVIESRDRQQKQFPALRLGYRVRWGEGAGPVGECVTQFFFIHARSSTGTLWGYKSRSISQMIGAAEEEVDDDDEA